MELNIADMRSIIAALEFELGYLEKEHARLDDSPEEQSAELATEIYQLELLRDSSKADYQQRISKIEAAAQEYFDGLKQNTQKRFKPKTKLVTA